MTVDANGCWVGPASSFELRLLKPNPNYALEQLRQRYLFALTSTHDLVKSARVLLQTAFETDIQATLAKLITLPAGVSESIVCQRRHFIDIDRDMQAQRFLIGPAFDALEATPNMPAPYMDLVRRYATADYPRYRVSAISAALCLATFLLVP